MAVSGTNIFSGTLGAGLFLSTNNGSSWTAVNNGIPYPYITVGSIVSDGTNIFAGTSYGLYKSINNGTNWSLVPGTINMHSSNGSHVVVNGSTIFVGVWGSGMYRSTNNGNSWTTVNSGLTDLHVNTVLLNGSDIYVGTEGGGIFRSTNNGNNWTAVNNGLSNYYIYALIASGSNIFAGTFGGGVFRSSNGGGNWTAVNNGLTYLAFASFSIDGSNIFAGSFGGGIYVSTNNGDIWTEISNGLTNEDIRAISITGSDIFAGSEGGGVFKSENQGTSWISTNTGLINSNVRSVITIGSSILVGTYGDGVLLSSNNGSTWTHSNSGLTNLYVRSLITSNDSIYVGTQNGVYLSTNYGLSWTSIGLTGYTVKALTIIGTNLIAGTMNGMFLTSNIGSSWTSINSGLPTINIECLTVKGATIFAGTNSGVFLSTNNGSNWTSLNNGFSNLSIRHLVTKGSTIFASAIGGDIYRYSDNEYSWLNISSSLPEDYIWSLIACESFIITGSGSGIYISSDDGNNWTSINTGFPDIHVFSLAIDGDSLIAGTQGHGAWISQLTCNEVVIVDQPANQTRNICSTATFSTSVNGTPGFNYIWYKNGVEIPDAIYSNYTTQPLQASDNGSSYYCIITNCCGTNQVTSNTATLTVIPPCKYDQPSVHLSASIVSSGENLIITGSNFTPYGEVTLSIRDESGSEVGTSIDISYPILGGFEFILPITPAFLHGKYTINAYDVSTGISAPTTLFHVNNFTEPGIHIISPNLGSVYGQGTLFDVVWTDFVGSNIENGLGGLISKSYKIEISLNGGQTWSIIWTDNHTEYAPPNQIHTFIFQNYSTYSSGTFILRITDLDDPADVDLSEPFTVYSCTSGGFHASLEWDPTVPDYIRNIKPNPIGIAADSTARIFIKLNKSASNDKLVSEIHGIITSSEYSTPALVGKIKYASNHLSYSTEGNNANLTSEIYNASTNANADDYWFWLVAPDDFTNNLDDERTYRELDVQFTISYLDNTSETIVLCNPVYIYRPALALVHGLDGDVSTFQYCRYTNNSNGESVFDPSFLWKVSKRFDLEEFGSFQTNAELLLNVGADEDSPYENSLLKLIEEMHIMGIANKRIDYVAHSMGGAAGRTAINYGNSWYNPGVQFKNYGNGYINKFITVCTPHNGSLLADLAVDIFPFLPLIPGFGLTYSSATFFDNIGFITKSGNLAPAVINMQSNVEGVPFITTNVKNHLIASDVDEFDNTEEHILTRSRDKWYINTIQWIADHFSNGSFHNLFINRYSNNEYFSETDLVVQLSSQLATKPENQAVRLNDNPLGIGKTSILYGIDKFHIGIVKDLTIGNRIKTLLNAQMNSGFFAKTIPAKPVIQNNLTSDPEFLSRMPTVDSVLNYIDTTKIKILTPETNQYFLVDSINDVVIKLKDTMNLQSILLYVQDQYFESISQDSLQTFSSAVGPNILGRNLIIAIAQYDSLGIIVNHIDTISIIVGSIDSLLSLVVNPRTVNLNPTEEFQPDHQLIYSNFIALLDPGHDSLFHSIVDTNVIQYDSAGIRFIAKDTGSTYIVFSYGQNFDTTFVYISQSSNSSIINLCSLDTISLFAGTADSTKVYQWQVDSLDGFVDIYDNAYYINTNDSVLTIANPPSYWYDYRYRCIISDPIGSKVGNIYTIRFKSIWNGAIDSLWHTAGNWSCDTIPNSHIDVLIPSNAPRYPHVTENAYCRTLRLEDTAQIIVDSPNLLCVSGDDRLVCPEDIVIKLCGQNEAIVEYDLSLSGTCGGTILQTSGYASGETFPVGTTTNCFQFTDELGIIVATCCFDVILLQDALPTITCTDLSMPCSEPFLPEDLVGIDTSIVSVTVSPNLPIGPGAGVVTEATIELTPIAGATIYDINVLVDLDHSWSDDLDVYIIAPDGTSVELATDVCGSSDNWADVIFDDEASITVNGACGGNPTLDGPVKPEGHLYDLDSMPVSGTWTLMITDDAGGDGGTFNTFGLSVEYTMTIPAYPIVDDDCEISSLTYTDSETTGMCPGYMAVNRLWTVFDNNGSSNTCNQTITFLPASLDSVTCPPTFVGSCNSYNAPGTTGYPIYNGVQIEESGLCNLFAFYSDQDTILEGYFTVLRTWRIVDTCTSLEIECVQNIVSYDNDSPLITCPDSIETSCLENISPGVTGYPIVEDDCSTSLTYTDSTVTGDCITIFSTITRTWTATDDSGNSSSCDQIVTLLTDDPQIICPADLAIALEPGQNDILVDYSITSLCSCSDSLVQISGIESGELFPVGTTTNCFELVDSNGVVVDSCCFDVFVFIHCLQGSIAFSTQNQIDSFPINYPGCTTIEGNVIIDDGGSGNITNLLGLTQVTIIMGDLLIQHNSNMLDLIGLDSLLSIGQDLYIDSNIVLTNLMGLGSLATIGRDFFIQSNNTLINLLGLDNLLSIGEDFVVQSNPALENLTGMSSLTSIEKLHVLGNSVLTSLSGLGPDTSYSLIIIEVNPSLTSLSGLNGITTIERFLYVGSNANLINFTGLESLTSIGEQLYIYSNPSLINLSGLESLISIGGFFNYSLTIDNNASLTSLSAMSSVTSIGGVLEITNNAVLTNLSGLDSINPNSITDIIIQGSSMLSICDVQSICDYLDIPTNPATISGNATGCATRMEVEDECGN